MPLNPTTPENLERVFAMIEGAAIETVRCPKKDELGSHAGVATKELTLRGRIRIEIFNLNWRVAEILVGPNKGKRTEPPPPPHTHSKPWKVLDVRGTWVNGVLRHPAPGAAQPSKPRVLSSEEL